MKDSLFKYAKDYNLKTKLLLLVVTTRCNAKCCMCSIWRKKNEDMTTALVEKLLLDQTLREELEYVGITGGEPSLSDEVACIVEIILKQCPSLKEISYNTNGLDTERIKTQILALSKIIENTKVRLNIFLSIDGIGAVHDTIRGCIGAYAKAEATLNMLEQISNSGVSFNLAINSVICRDNAESIPELFQVLSRKGLPVNLSLAMSTDTCIDSQQSSKDFLLKNIQKKKLIRFIKRLRAINQIKNDKTVGLEYINHLLRMLSGESRQIPCPFAFQGGIIEPNGKAYSCGKSQKLYLGNIKKNLFSRLKHCFYNRQNAYSDHLKICNSCESNCFLHAAEKYSEEEM